MPAENDATLKAPLIIATGNPEPPLTEILLVKIFRSGFRFSGCRGDSGVLSCMPLFTPVS